MKLLIGTLILGSLISSSATASPVKKITSAKSSSYEIVTNSREEYFKVKNNLLISMLNRTDWSEIDLKSSSSYIEKNLEQSVETTLYNEKNEPTVILCDYKYDFNFHIVVKDEKMVTISQKKNKKPINGSDCRDDLLKDELEVHSFIAPKKEEYKNILINALDMHAKYVNSFEDLKIPADEKTVFEVTESGYIVRFSNGMEESRHIATPVSFDFIFSEDMTYLSNLSKFNSENLDMNERVTFVCKSEVHYSGVSNFMMMSYYVKFSPEKIECKDTTGEGLKLGNLLNELGF